MFVTSGTRNATSPNMVDYNTFVNNAAQASTTLNTALTNAGFTPSAINARVNTATQTTDTSVPIYRLDSTLVATSYADLWDGSIGAPIYVNEAGNGPVAIPTGVWTGLRNLIYPNGSRRRRGYSRTL